MAHIESDKYWGDNIEKFVNYGPAGRLTLRSIKLMSDGMFKSLIRIVVFCRPNSLAVIFQATHYFRHRSTRILGRRFAWAIFRQTWDTGNFTQLPQGSSVYDLTFLGWWLPSGKEWPNTNLDHKCYLTRSSFLERTLYRWPCESCCFRHIRGSTT